METEERLFVVYYYYIVVLQLIRVHYPNTTLFHVHVVLGVLKCRHRSCSLPQGRVDPWITRYINKAGFEGLFHVLDLKVDHVLITTLVEHWRLEMHTFHLPHGEMGITLQDIQVMLEVLVDGFPMVGKTNFIWKDMGKEFLGYTPPPPVPHPNENKSVLARARIKVNWLDAQFRVPLVANANDVEV